MNKTERGKGTKQSCTYDAITKHAEQLIVEYMGRARECDDFTPMNQYVDWAYGVYSFWHGLAFGFATERIESDNDRLLALVKAQDGRLHELNGMTLDLLERLGAPI